MSLLKMLVVVFVLLAATACGGEEPATLLEDIESARTWLAGALNESGYAVSGDVDSLRELDRFLDENIDDETHRPRENGILATNPGPIIFAVGAYVGGVIIDRHGGEWLTDDTDPRGEINVEVRLPNGIRVWPVQRVLKRILDGRMNGIHAYAASLEEREE